MALLYREVTVVLSIPSESQDDADKQANDIVRAQLSHLRSDESRLPIRAWTVEGEAPPTKRN
jgi:hypothetical protein